MNNKTLEANQEYITKCKSFLETILFKVNKDILYDQITNLIAEYVDLLKAINASNMSDEYKAILRLQTKVAFQQRVKNQTDLNLSHPALVGTLVNLFRAIHRHYNILNRKTTKEDNYEVN